MIAFLALYSVIATILLAWLFMRNTNLSEENEYLADHNRKLDAENKEYRDNKLMDEIEGKTALFSRDEDGIPILVDHTDENVP